MASRYKILLTLPMIAAGLASKVRGAGLPFSALPEMAHMLRQQWEQTTTLEMTTGQTIPTVFHWNDLRHH